MATKGFIYENRKRKKSGTGHILSVREAILERIKKESAAINAWEKGIAPSAELRKWFNHDPEKYPEFRRKYMEELDASEDAERFLGFVNEHLRSTNITLLYAAKDEEHNNALVLRDWLARDKENKYES